MSASVDQGAKVLIGGTRPDRPGYFYEPTVITDPPPKFSLTKSQKQRTELMKRHGATVAGTTLREAVFRSINGCLNAEYQWKAMAIGRIGPLTPTEARLGGAYNLQERPLARAYEYWTLRLGERANFPTRAKTAKASAKKAAPRKRTKKSASKRRR